VPPPAIGLTRLRVVQPVGVPRPVPAKMRSLRRLAHKRSCLSESSPSRRLRGRQDEGPFAPARANAQRDRHKRGQALAEASNPMGDVLVRGRVSRPKNFCDAPQTGNPERLAKGKLRSPGFVCPGWDPRPSRAGPIATPGSGFR